MFVIDPLELLQQIFLYLQVFAMIKSDNANCLYTTFSKTFDNSGKMLVVQ